MNFNELKNLILEVDQPDEDTGGGQVRDLGNFDIEDKFKPDEEISMPTDKGQATNQNQLASTDSKTKPNGEENQSSDEEKENKDKKPKMSQEDREVRTARDKLIAKFNDENKDSTYVKLVEYSSEDDDGDDGDDENGSTKAFTSFKVTLTLDPEEIYLNKNKYVAGEGKIELNKVFYKDIEALAKEIGIAKVSWEEVGEDGSTIGTVHLTSSEKEEDVDDEKDEDEVDETEDEKDVVDAEEETNE